MDNNTDFIELYKEVLTGELIDELIEYIDSLDKDYSLVPIPDIPSNISLGRHHFGSALFRNDLQVYLNEYEMPELKNKVLDLLIPYFHKYAATFSLSKEGLSFNEVKIQKTEKYGNYSFWHSEVSGIVSSARVLAWSVYLNDVPEAGETEFLFQQRRVRPKRGVLMVWPAAYTHLHRGNPPIGGDKYIITGWGIYTSEN